MIAFLLMEKEIKWQLAVSFGMIILSDLLYRLWPVDGFNQPFTPDHNFGSWVDMATTGCLSDDNGFHFNAIPTTAHTIWGVLVGKLLMKEWPHRKKILVLLITGIIRHNHRILHGSLYSDYKTVMHKFFHDCKRRILPNCHGILLLAYRCAEIQKVGLFFAIVGMNPIFIYLFSNLGGKNLLERNG